MMTSAPGAGRAPTPTCATTTGEVVYAPTTRIAAAHRRGIEFILIAVWLRGLSCLSECADDAEATGESQRKIRLVGATAARYPPAMSANPMVADNDDDIARRLTALGIRAEDIEETFVRSGGHGGQNVNKTSTCKPVGR